MHVHAWVAWVALVMAIALTSTNPFYLVIVLLSVILVAVLAPKTGSAVAGLRALAIFGVALFAISIAIAAINGNSGSHILFTMPGPDIPGWLGGLRLGGPVSAEGIVAATIRGLTILCIFLAFGVFNGAVRPHRVLRMAPAALFHAGLVVTIGLTLLPASVEDLRRLREMRALRGARSGIRELPALVVPAVIGGLERSMRLAEAMEARGYASAPPAPRLSRLAGAASAPLLLAAAWGWYYYEGVRPLAGFTAILGAALLGYWGWSASRSRQTTRFHVERATSAGRAAVAGCWAMVGLAVVAGTSGWFGLRYNPFDGLSWPGFSLPGALVAISCAWPAVRLMVVVPKEEPAAEVAEPLLAMEAGPP